MVPSAARAAKPCAGAQARASGGGVTACVVGSTLRVTGRVTRTRHVTAVGPRPRAFVTPAGTVAWLTRPGRDWVLAQDRPGPRLRTLTRFRTRPNVELVDRTTLRVDGVPARLFELERRKQATYDGCPVRTGTKTIARLGDRVLCSWSQPDGPDGSTRDLLLCDLATRTDRVLDSAFADGWGSGRRVDVIAADGAFIALSACSYAEGDCAPTVLTTYFLHDARPARSTAFAPGLRVDPQPSWAYVFTDRGAMAWLAAAPEGGLALLVAAGGDAVRTLDRGDLSDLDRRGETLSWKAGGVAREATL